MARPTIELLNDLTIARIAAGEVVERPASVVKELIENSLDAGARRIDVEIVDGGQRLIRVVDDGGGIADAEQLALAFAQHATSKLRAAEELESVATLGFRGEALASIASVSQVTAVSRTAEGSGHRLRIDNGVQVALEPTGAPGGTSITVENLFNAVPARRKFLRQASTEAAQIHDLVARYALAFPDRSFSLRSNQREVFRSMGGGDLASALAAVLGPDAAASLLPAETRRDAIAPPSGPLRVTGFISPPFLHRATRRYVVLMVNGRPIQDPRLQHAVLEAYHTLIPKGRFPLVALRIELPAAGVDVNVHPAKTEVRFRDARLVYGAVQQAVREALLGDLPIAPAGRLSLGDPLPHLDLGRSPGAKREEARVWERTRPSWSRPTGIAEPEMAHYVLPESGASPTAASPASTALPALRLIGQLARAYVLAEGPDGLYLVDQHAAHERIQYERMMARSAPMAGQTLLAPLALNITAAQAAQVETHSALLRSLGLDLEAFGPTAVLVRSLPEVLAEGEDPAEVVHLLIDLLDSGDNPVDEALEARLVRAVCKRASVKAGQSLSLPELRRLLDDLEACAVPRTCPHGRPTVIHVSLARIDQLFGR